MKTVSIIGGGPAALMLAAHLDSSTFDITIYEQKKTLGRKFLVAGEGGLNLTFNSSLKELETRYSPREFMSPFLRQFNNTHLRDWLDGIGIETFSGSSSRVFPIKGIKPITVLNTIIQQVENNKVKIQLGKRWIGWDPQDHLIFEDKTVVKSDITVFSLGGASWKVTGSDGHWASIFANKKITVLPFRAANCAFSVAWNQSFIHHHAGKPLKNIELYFEGLKTKGEIVITTFGLEGNAIYALSEEIQRKLKRSKTVPLSIDLKPTLTSLEIEQKLITSKRKKTTDILERDLKLSRTAVALLKAYTNKETFTNLKTLSNAIKSLEVKITKSDTIDHAISSLGGIAIEELDQNQQLKKISNHYAIGEMVDWFAPTGGYLLQGCFSMGFSLANHLNHL